MIQEFLFQLEKAKPSGKNKYLACCPAHNDSSPSMVIFDHTDKVQDPKIGVHCFAGCSVEEITSALGMKVKDLYVDQPEQSDYEERAFIEEMRARKARERSECKLYGELAVIMQCIEARMFSKEPQIKGKFDAWDREKQAARQVYKLLQEYYK